MFLWMTIAASLIGGGAAGAIISSRVSRKRAERQPVDYRIDFINIFKKNPAYPSLDAHISYGREQPDGPLTVREIETFSLARITIINKGNRDLPEFIFGVTLSDTDKALDVKVETPDRHHIMQVLTPVNPLTASTEIDVSVQPFNREEEYILNVYFTHEDEPGRIQLSTPHSTKLIEKRTLQVSQVSEESPLRSLSANPVFTLILGFLLTGLFGGVFTVYSARLQQELAAKRTYSDEVNRVRAQKVGQVWERIDENEFAIDGLLEQPFDDVNSNAKRIENIERLIQEEFVVISNNRFWLGEGTYNKIKEYLDLNRKLLVHPNADLRELIQNRKQAKQEILQIRTMFLEGDLMQDPSAGSR